MIDVLKKDLREHGELHLVVEEHESVAGDDFIGVRKGNTEINENEGYIAIYASDTTHVIGIDRVVSYHLPNNFPD